MNTITTHCVYAPKAPIEPASVEKPPVDMVVSAWATAWNGVISPSMRSTASVAVSPT